MKPDFVYIRGIKCWTEVYFNGTLYIPMVAIDGPVSRWRAFAGGVLKTEEAAWNFFQYVVERGLLPTDKTGFPDEESNTQEAKKEVA